MVWLCCLRRQPKSETFPNNANGGAAQHSQSLGKGSINIAQKQKIGTAQGV